MTRTSSKHTRLIAPQPEIPTENCILSQAATSAHTHVTRNSIHIKVFPHLTRNTPPKAAPARATTLPRDTHMTRTSSKHTRLITPQPEIPTENCNLSEITT